jgi:AcrR family transcriptional regulator
VSETEVPVGSAATSQPGQEPGAAPLGPKRAATRARLLAAAREVFETTDFHAVRVSDIAERAGLSYGLFYFYFASREAIFREIAAAVAEEALGSDQVFLEADNPWPAETSMRLFLENHRRASPMIRALEAVARHDPEVEAVRARLYRERYARFAGYLRQAQAEGRMDTGLDPDMAAIIIVNMALRFAESWLVRTDMGDDFEHALEQVGRIMSNALRLTPPGSHSG